MDKPIKKLIAKSNNKFTGEKTLKSSGKSRPRKIVKQGITKEQFLANLGKVCQPIKSDSEKIET